MEKCGGGIIIMPFHLRCGRLWGLRALPRHPRYITLSNYTYSLHKLGQEVRGL